MRVDMFRKISIDSIRSDRFDPILNYIQDIPSNKSESKSLKNILKIKGVYVGGGALRTLIDKTLTINDIDLFFDSRETMDKVWSQLMEYENLKTTFICPKRELVSFKGINGEKIQLIGKYFAQPEVFVENFDINACRLIMSDTHIWIGKNAITDNKKKLITINKVTYPVATIKRVAKYATYGYRLRGIDSEDLVNKIREIPEDDLDMELYVD